MHVSELAAGPGIFINVWADTDSPVSKRQLAESLVDSGEVNPEKTLVVSDLPMDLEMMALCKHWLLIADPNDLVEVHGLFGPREKPVPPLASEGVSNR